MKLAPNAPTVRWMADWVEVQKEKMLDLLERGWETMQPLHRPHDQVRTFAAAPEHRARNGCHKSRTEGEDAGPPGARVGDDAAPAQTIRPGQRHLSRA